MNPLPNDWAIKHRADTCAATHRPFEAGEYFYTLLFRDADGFRREDLSEEGWKNRNENIQPFSFWKTRYEPVPESAPEPLAKENAEQLFRRLIASENPPANACYVLAAMLERKRVLKQIKTENAEKGRIFGESMFHRVTDASKIALVALVERLCAHKFALLDTQWTTPHLQQFGAVEISRDHYLKLLRRAIELPREF